MFCFSLINGYVFIGQIQAWAFINKFVGWFVLLYLILGALVNLSFNEKHKNIFFNILLLCSSFICLLELRPIIETHLGFNDYWRPIGLTGNPNAFGFLLVIIFLTYLSIN